MGVRLLDLNQDTLQQLRIIVGKLEGKGDMKSIEFLLIDNGRFAVNPHRLIHARDEEQQSYAWVAVHVLVRLK